MALSNKTKVGTKQAEDALDQTPGIEAPETATPETPAPSTTAAPTGLRRGAPSQEADAPEGEGQGSDFLKVKNAFIAALTTEKTPDSIVKRIGMGFGITNRVASGVIRAQPISENGELATSLKRGAVLATAAIQEYETKNFKNTTAQAEFDSIVKVLDNSTERVSKSTMNEEGKASELAAIKVFRDGAEAALKSEDKQYEKANTEGLRALNALLQTRFAAFNLVKETEDFKVPSFRQMVKSITGWDADKINKPAIVVSKLRSMLYAGKPTDNFAFAHENRAQAALGITPFHQKEGLIPATLFAIPKGEAIEFRKLLKEGTANYLTYKAEQSEKNAAHAAEETTRLEDALKGIDVAPMDASDKETLEKGLELPMGKGQTKNFSLKREEDQKAFWENLTGLAKGDENARAYFQKNWMSRELAFHILAGPADAQ